MVCDNISRDENGRLQFAGFDCETLARKYATPLYLMDEEKIRENCRMYKKALLDSFGENASAVYASKAAAFKQIYRIMNEEGMSVDAVSLGEIYTALSVGFPAEKIYFHGNAKTDADIAEAIGLGIGCFVSDCIEELDAIERICEEKNRTQKVLLRITPGIDPHTYEAISTGKVDSKFGVAVETGQAIEAVGHALSLSHIELEGVHCHVGSSVFDEDVYEQTADIMLPFMAQVRERYGVTLSVFDIGGGYGVRYLESDKHIDIPARIAALAEHIKHKCAELDFPLPFFHVEPGRSIVADAGMTLYTTAAVKRITGYKSYVAIDGGMADNPRYALYGAPYTVLPCVDEGVETEVFDLVGRCCESGDVIQPKVALPKTVKRGDIIAVCTTGAYNYSMASNYNRLPKPPVVMLSPKGDYVAVRRESVRDVAAMDN